MKRSTVLLIVLFSLPFFATQTHGGKPASQPTCTINGLTAVTNTVTFPTWEDVPQTLVSLTGPGTFVRAIVRPPYVGGGFRINLVIDGEVVIDRTIQELDPALPIDAVMVIEFCQPVWFESSLDIVAVYVCCNTFSLTAVVQYGQ